ncbi:MAG: peptidoglycan DD-metalloendopeptidase family protein [Acidimicrobiales bacterium]
MSRHRSFLVLLLLALTAGLAGPTAAEPAIYRPPVDAPVVDGFRLPNGPFGAGNRGLEYDTVPGQVVRAIGDGLVVFAGPVAGIRYVTVLHPDGLRSSYGYLADLLVAAGERIVIGQVVGTAGERLHLGVRSGGTYLDPAALFTTTGVHLVPLESGQPHVSGSRDASPATRGVDQNAVWAWLTGGGAGGVAGTLARRS